MSVTQISQALEHRIQSEISRAEAMTTREQINPRHDPERWGAVLLRESIRVLLLAGLSRCRIAAALRAVANDVTHGREIRPGDRL